MAQYTLTQSVKTLEKLFENKIEIGNKDEIQQKEFKIRINKRIKVFE